MVIGAPSSSVRVSGVTRIRPLHCLICLLFMIMGAGCGLFDPSEHVHSPFRPPDRQTSDGLYWSALKCDGMNDEWFYVPSEVAIASRELDGVNGAKLKLLLPNGKTYQLTTNADGKTFTFDGYVDADYAANPNLVLWLIVASGVAVISILIAGSVIGGYESRVQKLKVDQGELATAQSESEKIKNDLSRDERALQRERQRFEEQRQASDRSLESERNALRKEQEELQQCKQTLAIAHRGSGARRHGPTKRQWKSAGEAMRARVFSGQAVGNSLVVNHFFDPGRSGIVSFQWEITSNLAFPPHIIMYRDAKQFREESGMFKGEFTDRLLQLDRRYSYEFKLFDGTRELPSHVIFELLVPPFAALDFEASKAEAAADRKRKKDSWRNTQYQYAEQFAADPATLQAKKAAVDEEANSKFGED